MKGLKRKYWRLGWVLLRNGAVIVPVALLLFATADGQTPLNHGKPTENVVIQYEQLVANGSFLTPEGWQRASKLYEQTSAFPSYGEIYLMTTGGSLGEMWMNGDRAEVQTKWTDYFGTIDSALRYDPPKGPPPAMTSFVFRLVYTNKHRDIGKNGEVLKEIIGPWRWKIEQPEASRWTTVERALEYLTMMREKTDDPAIQRNADKTIAALKRLTRSCGNASAC
jgi:hypothetical protein